MSYSNTTYIVNTNPTSFLQQHQIIPASSHHRAIPHNSHHHGDSNKPLVRGKTSPYGFFVKMCYEEHKKKYPNENVQVTEISKKCSQKWKTMSDDEKKRFFELAQKDAERYQAEVAAYGGEDVLRKRKRAKKDPNAPKRALSAFFFFSNEKRPEVQQSHPEWKVGQIAQELGRYWKTLTEQDREIYDKKAAEDKERYAEDMRIYRETLNKPHPTPSHASQALQLPQHQEQAPPQDQQQQSQHHLEQQQQHHEQQQQHHEQQQLQLQTQQMVIIQQPGQLPMQILEEHVSI
uniref:HMG box domain-containing protein n=1 Tax=Ditylenchus dipsaci TaxID=166011 RepID=A0A915E562_9BILA